jgi:cytochrome c biogenesis protein CcmG/thiol:disulfide interchange protein DsbE
MTGQPALPPLSPGAAPVSIADPRSRPRRRRWLGLLAVLLAAATAVAILGVGLGRDPSLVRSALIGSPAPPLAGPTIDGHVVDLRQYRGQVVLVNVWASWCFECRREHPVLVDAQSQLGPYGLQILGIDLRDTDTDALAFQRERGGASWPSIRDSDSLHAVEWGTFAVPETYLVDRQGTIVSKAVGAITATWIARNVTPMLSR